MTSTLIQFDVRRYLWTVGLAVGGLLFLAVTLNYMVDPYFIHQWDTPALKRLSPPQQKIMPWAKTYAAYRYQPEVVFIGSSRTEIGLPTDSELLAGKRVLNLAISGASLGDAANMLRHTGYFRRPDVAVWGLDYGWQFGPQRGNSDFSDELIARDSWYPFKRFLLNLKRSMSLTLSRDAWKILLGLSDQKCLPMLASRGHKSDQCLEYIMADEGGTGKAFDKIVNQGDPSGSPGRVKEGMQLLDEVTKEYCAKGTAFRFFLQPVHALAELSYWETAWQEQEQWKRDLTELFDRRRSEGCDIRFMDFSGFNRITTEDIPQITGRDTMRYYWEYSHYNSEAGRRILERLLPPTLPAEPDDFGTELTRATIDQHLGDFRRKREAYCASHPLETANMRLCKENGNG